MKKILLHSCCAPCLTSVYEQLSKTYQVVVFWYNPNIWPKAEHDKRYDELLRYTHEMNIEVIQGNYNYKEEHQYFLGQIKGLEKEPEKGRRCLKCYEIRLAATAWTAQQLNSSHSCAIPASPCVIPAKAGIQRSRFDFFASELSVSPHKDAEALNKIGAKIEAEVNLCHPRPDRGSTNCIDSRLRGNDSGGIGNDSGGIGNDSGGSGNDSGGSGNDKKSSEDTNVKYLPSDFKKAGGFRRSVELSKEADLYRQNYCGCEFSIYLNPDK